MQEKSNKKPVLNGKKGFWNFLQTNSRKHLDWSPKTGILELGSLGRSNLSKKSKRNHRISQRNQISNLYFLPTMKSKSPTTGFAQENWVCWKKEKPTENPKSTKSKAEVHQKENKTYKILSSSDLLPRPTQQRKKAKKTKGKKHRKIKADERDKARDDNQEKRKRKKKASETGKGRFYR